MMGPVVALWVGLAAQGVTGPDSAAHARSAALQELNDSVSVVEAAAGQFQTDLSSASPDLVISRADRLSARCTGARSAAATLDPLLAPRTSLRASLAALRTELARCQVAFTTGRARQPADSIKAWAPYRLARLGDAVRRYRNAARAFMRQEGIH